CCQQATVITDFTNLKEAGHDHYMNIHGGCASMEELEQLDGVETAVLLIEDNEGTITRYGVSRLVMEFSAVTEMYHLHHTESVRNCHADLGGQLQSGSGDMAVIRLLSQHPDPTAGFPGQHRCGIHIEKHLSIPVAHLFHVLFPHHGHATFTHGVKDDFNLSKPREHPQKAHN